MRLSVRRSCIDQSRLQVDAIGLPPYLGPRCGHERRSIKYGRFASASLTRSDERLIMIVQAFIDDSGSDPQSLAFILAGFVASPRQWAAFREEWERTLHRPPRLEYFKNNEAMGLKDQFGKNRGWTEQKRDDRLVALAQVIRKYIPKKFSIAMRHGDYKNYMYGIPVRRRMKTLEDPYFLLFHELMLVVASVHSLEPKAIPCHFVFDDQGKIGQRARAWWPTFRKSMSKAKFDFSPYFTGSPPDFRKDTEFTPLQAADLYAGQLNRVMVSDKIIIPPSPALRALLPISGLHRVLDYNYLAPMRNHFMRMADKIEAETPGTLKYVLGKPTTKNKRA